MTSEEIMKIQRRVIGLVRTARSGVAALEQRVNSILGSARPSDQAKTADAASALGEGRAEIQTIIEDEAGGVMRRALAQVDGVLGRLKDVSPGELARSEMGLRAALNAASGRPELLLNLYRERHLRRRADRVLIEEVASGMIDALGDEDNYGFRDAWNELQQELALARSPEELEALGHRATLEELDSYLENARTLVQADLALVDRSLPRADRDRILSQRPFSEAEVNRYEAENAWVIQEDPGQAVQGREGVAG